MLAGLTLAVLASDGRAGDLAVGRAGGPGRRARCGSTSSALAAALIAIFAAAVVRRPLDPRARGRGRRARRVLLAAARLGARDDPARRGAEPGQLLRRARAALDPALRDVRLGDPQGGLARVGAQVPDRSARSARRRCSTASPSSTAPPARPTTPAIAEALGPGGEADDTLILIGTAMAAVGLAFKVSLAPFHQWTPDVYQGAPTPVTAFMAVATKAAAFIAFARLFEVALGPRGRRLAAGARGARGRPRSSSATSARSARTRSSACSATRASPRPATCSPGSSSPPRPGSRRWSSTSPPTA